MTLRANPIKPKKCRECKAPFIPRRPLQPTCDDIACKTLYALKIAAKAERKREKIRQDEARAQKAEDKAKIEAMRPRKYWKAKLKTVQHAYVRARDEGRPCISCDTILVKTGRVGGDYDAGHCRSVGSAKHLEFDPRNIHGQCKHCNSSKGLGGNYHEYRKRLPARIGQEAFDALMCDQDARHYTIDQLRAEKARYEALLKEIKA